MSKIPSPSSSGFPAIKKMTCSLSVVHAIKQCSLRLGPSSGEMSNFLEEATSPVHMTYTRYR